MVWLYNLTCIRMVQQRNYELQTEIFCEAAHLVFCETNLEMSRYSWAGCQFALISLQLVENLIVFYLAEKIIGSTSSYGHNEKMLCDDCTLICWLL